MMRMAPRARGGTQPKLRAHRGGNSMTRGIARPLTILAMILGLTLASIATPASAGNSSGAGGLDLLILFLQGAGPGTCAYTVDQSSGHSFLGVKTEKGVKLIGPLDAQLPDEMSSACTFFAF